MVLRAPWVNFLIIICGISVTAVANAETKVVQTDKGAVRGAVSDGVAAFRGIPYAAPPTGALRWQDPQPAIAWNGTRDALSDGAACPQDCALPTVTCPTEISESCLFLNVFAPASAPSPGALRPIMVFVHGGNFYQGYGGGLLYDGSHFVRDHGVVVVALNYRLGALGFLRTGDDAEAGDWTGNFGLKDQQQALRWVQRNAAAFGGDRRRVTLFGQSAGAASTGAHLVMPSSRGLFGRVIMQSNPLGLPFRSAKKYPKFAKVVARKANCTGGLLEGSRKWQRCLMGRPWQDIVAAQGAAQKDLLADVGQFLSLFQPFSPAVGTAELPAQTFRALLDGTAADVPVLLGSVRQEGVIFLYEAFGSAEPVAEEKVLVDLVYGLQHEHKIFKQYPLSPAVQEADDARNHTALIATDSLFHCPARHAALALVQNPKRSSPTFMYHFDHIISFGAKFWLPTSPVCVDTVCHAEELPFVFNPDLSIINATFTPPEALLAKSMQTFWTNFAKSDRPESDGTITWPAFNGSEQVLRFTADPVNTIDTARYATKCSFWDKLGYKWIL